MSNRIKLINCTKEILEEIIKGDEALAAFLTINVPSGWSEFGQPVFEYAFNQLENAPNDSEWWTYLPILISENVLIGSCGYKGAPQDETVEIGYEVAHSYRNQGLATEMANLLIVNALKSPNVKHIKAHTLAEENASVRVLKKLGFSFVQEIDTKEDGLVWKWLFKE